MRKYAISDNTGAETMKVENRPIKWLNVTVNDKELIVQEMREGIIGEEVVTTHRYFSDSPIQVKIAGKPSGVEV